MKKIKSELAVRCPECKVLTPRVYLAGKQALCINSDCPITKFTVQNFDDIKKEGVSRKNKSYNNSARR